jgi:putative DNA primase/helicase
MLANAEYRAEMNIVQAFIDDCCNTEMQATVTSKDLYQSYIDWCIANGEKSESQKMFGHRILGLPHGITSRKIDNKRTWVGIRLI